MSKNFIGLADVKINNDYTYIRSVAPTAAEKAPAYSNGETWLDTVTGYSYVLTDEVTGVWARIEIDIDNKILFDGPLVFSTVIKYLNNFFITPRVLNYFDNYETNWPGYFTRDQAWLVTRYECVFSDCTFDAAAGTVTVDDVYGSLTDTFATGDTVFISGTRRNNGYYTISGVTAEALTITEALADETAPSFLFFADVPAALIAIIARMVWYDIYSRPTGAGLKSERVGTYSYTRQDQSSTLNYPDDIIGGLSAFMSIDIEGTAYFVN